MVGLGHKGATMGSTANENKLNEAIHHPAGVRKYEQHRTPPLPTTQEHPQNVMVAGYQLREAEFFSDPF